MTITEVLPSDVPVHLLLLADPSEQAIGKYLRYSRCFVADNGDTIVGVCILKPSENDVLELMNIAVLPAVQQGGIGSKLLQHVIEICRQSGARRLEVGTGTFGYPLAFYQRAGFRVTGIDKDFFLVNYTDPVFENGIQHKDMLRLSLEFDYDYRSQDTVTP